jgi:HK97 gp10 family phage protein
MAKKRGYEVKITGADEMAKKLESLGRNWRKAVKKALHQEASLVKDDAHDRTPHDEGPLRGSYDLKVTQRRHKVHGLRLLAKILVGGPSEPYAAYVHEHGPRAGGPGERHFLKNAFDAVRHTISARLSARIKQNHGLR